LLATPRTTCASPRVTITSVTASPIARRRDRQEVLLAARARDPHEVALVQALGMLQNRTRHRGGAVEGEVPDHLNRGVRHRRERRRQLRPGLRLDVAREPQDDLVEGADLSRVQPRGLIGEQARHLAEHVHAPGGIAAGDGALDVSDNSAEHDHEQDPSFVARILWRSA
jgi:hypothetical protein